MVANLRPVKDPETFVRAAAQVVRTHANVQFCIAGSGEMQGALERLASELDLEGRFQLAGPVGDVPAFLGSLDVAALCSRSEGMSNAILEYMAAGRPIVATAVGANAQLIEDGHTGLLVRPGDASELAGAIRRLLEAPGWAAQLGAAARQRCQDKYSREHSVHRFEDFFLTLAGRSRAGAWS